MRICIVGICSWLILLGLQASLPAQEKLTFEQHVRPILKAYCLDCHGGDAKEGNLDLRLKRFAAQGGDSGAALVAGDAGKSLLIERMKSGEMPPGEKKVPAEQIALIERWIAAGATNLRDEPDQLPPGLGITEEERAFWSFQPLVRHEPPKFDAVADRVRSPIDAFVLAKLRERGLNFAPDADRRTQIRRVALDLTGLPPTTEEVERFVNDNDPTAYEQMVDRYLQSQHYGERWGRHWLDVAGYADSDGNGTDDTPRPYAYKYRDYVIRAFNADKPLNQFIIEQLAGDELVPTPWKNLSAEQIETLSATGFLRMAIDPTAGGGDPAEGANQVVADTLKIVGSSLLGLTVGCAQCHDHRYDPIPQADYFRLRAVFEPALSPKHWRRPAQRLVSLATDEDRARSAAIEDEVKQMQAQYNEKQNKYVAAAFDQELLKFPEEQRAALRQAFETPGDKRDDAQKQLVASNPKLNINPGVLYQYNEKAAEELKTDQEKIAAKRAEKPKEDFLSVLSEIAGQRPETHIFHRGDYRQPKEVVRPGDLSIATPSGGLTSFTDRDPQQPTTGRRLALARHWTSGQHPLVGRTLANRIWLQHFGRGLAETPGDLGALGTRPTHPELLDWLASELPRQGWSLKQMHRLIMNSTVYRQSSKYDAAQSAADKENFLYSRFPLQRLDAEAFRDRMLMASGQLQTTMFGPAVKASEDFTGQVVVSDDQPRRSIYLETRRSKPVSFLTVFDAPVMTVNCERRVPSTSAPQSLMLMNSDFVLKQAAVFAQRVRRETPGKFAEELAAPLASRFNTASAWQYGYGEVHEANGQLASFTPLAHFSGTAWQGGATVPDAQTGWVLLHAGGGHPGDNPKFAAIRRFTAPRAGSLTIKGSLQHPSPNGDGVRGRVISSRAGALHEWIAKTNTNVVTELKIADVQAGETIDFVVDCRQDTNADSFEWPVELTLAVTDGGSEGWHSVHDFRGPQATSLPQQIAWAWQIAYQRLPSAEELDLASQFVAWQIAHLKATKDKTDHELAALTNLCQQLLSSNEFLYVD